MKKEAVKVIFDTNVWISFLIGKRLSKIKQHIFDNRIIIITTDQLLIEIQDVTSRNKLKKYFPKESVLDLIELLQIIAQKIEIKSSNFICNDPKDNFLFDLIEYSRADYLVTGDKDILIHHPFKNTQILSPAEFEKLFDAI